MQTDAWKRCVIKMCQIYDIDYIYIYIFNMQEFYLALQVSRNYFIVIQNNKYIDNL